MAQAAQASVIIQFDFNDVAGTVLGPGFNGPQPTVGSATWGFNIPTSTTNGSGQLVNAGTFSTTTALTTFDPIRADSGTYELAYKGVTFNNLGADDFLVFGFFSSNSGSPPPGFTTTASGASRSFLKFGNFNGADGIDFAYGPNRDSINTSFNQGSLASTYDLFIELDTNAKSVSFFYSADGGARTQIGNTISGIPIGTDDGATGGTASASYRTLVMRGQIATGASISIDQVQLSSVIPEPSTYAIIGGILVLGIALVRRRS